MSILADLQLIIIAILGAIVSGAGAFLVGGWRGKRKADDKHELERLNNYVERKNRIEEAVRETEGMSDDDVAEWLRKRSER